ncbi:cytochrome P450 78A5-like [Rutidosis leptorrhynchoides]|uniref:cytochrome P450 78A5-like n=1 Tax=Rutidosis leptorrhynchoides TaxID=125765 RepID=UPI003A999B77
MSLLNLSLLIIPLFLFLTLTWSLSLISFSLLFTLFSILLNFWLVPGGFAWRNFKSLNLRGPIGLPLLGSLPLMMNSLSHRKLASIAFQSGAKRLMAFSQGTTRVIISSHPETAKEILSGSSFSDRPVKTTARLLMFERAIGFAPSGTYWRHLRRIAANHMFSPKNISLLQPIRHRLAQEMVSKVNSEMETNGVVEIRGILQKGSLRNIIKSVFGKMENNDEISDMVREGYELISMANMEDYFNIPFLMRRYLDFYGVKRRCQELSGKVKRILGVIVKDRRGQEDGKRHDFLSTLLSLPKEDQLNDDDMIAVLWEMIFRGTDTVAILLEWIMARMVLHNDIQTKVQQEIDSTVGNNRLVQDTDIPKLPYLQAIVKEVLRLHPPGPLLSWARLATHDVYVDKCLIPAGTTAMVNMWAITHDSSVWKDPSVFKPERFIEEDVPIMGSDLRLSPFGSGRRVCPGKALGLATVHLWLARMLQQFTWVPSQRVDLSECLRLSLEMKKPLECCAVSRNVYR